MRTKFSILAVAALALLVSCNKHESSLTGSYGQRVVSGQVVMASDMTNSSPAGVAVSVIGTGMSATLSADGRFTFVGVPDKAELSFQRADGINARMPVTSNSMNIELNSHGGSSKHRGASAQDPQKSTQIEGVIDSVAADSITVIDSHKNSVQVAIDSSTLIRGEDKTLALTDLKKGDRVHVKAVMKNNVLTALQVNVQEPENEDEHNNQQQEIKGTVAAVNGTTLTVTPAGGGSNVDITLTPTTMIRKGNQTITAADLKKGDVVEVKASMVNNTLTASQVNVENEDNDQKQQQEINGTVAGVAGNTLTITPAGGGTNVDVMLTPTTVIRKGNQMITAADLKKGDVVEVKASMVNNVLTATQVNVENENENEPAEMEVEGTVSAINGNALTVGTRSGDVTVNTDANTVIRKDGNTLSLSDIKMGDRIDAQGTSTDAHTLNATRIEVKDSSHND
ncbi:MAG TPA: DUF5666 domain-containing protein [Thermoanaerobaculia bacterium]